MTRALPTDRGDFGVGILSPQMCSLVSFGTAKFTTKMRAWPNRVVGVIALTQLIMTLEQWLGSAHAFCQCPDVWSDLMHHTRAPKPGTPSKLVPFLTRTHFPSLSLTHTLSLSQSDTHTLSLSHWHTHTHFLCLTLSLFHWVSFSLSLSLTHTLSLSLTHSRVAAARQTADKFHVNITIVSAELSLSLSLPQCFFLTLRLSLFLFLSL